MGQATEPASCGGGSSFSYLLTNLDRWSDSLRKGMNLLTGSELLESLVSSHLSPFANSLGPADYRGRLDRGGRSFGPVLIFGRGDRLIGPVDLTLTSLDF